MNKQKRKRLADISEQLENLRVEIEQILEEEQEAFENLPESLQESERGEIMNGKIDNIESAISSLEEVVDYLTEAQE